MSADLWIIGIATLALVVLVGAYRFEARRLARRAQAAAFQRAAVRFDGRPGDDPARRHHDA